MTKAAKKKKMVEVSYTVKMICENTEEAIQEAMEKIHQKVAAEADEGIIDQECQVKTVAAAKPRSR